MLTMTNKEIVNKIDKLLKEDLDFCSLELELQKMEFDYKKSSFYKQTKMPLKTLVKEYRLNKICKLDELDTTNLLKVINKLQDVFAIDYENNKDLIDKVNSFLKDKGE